MKKSTNAMHAPLRVDKERWSRSSKQSLAYDFAKKTYKDIPYICNRCHAHAVFTAEDQKKSFEVRQSYIWQRRVLCKVCWSEEQKIARALERAAQEWKEKKIELLKDTSFQRRWLALLEQHPTFGARKNSAAIAMLSKLLTSPTNRSNPTRRKRRAV